MKTAIIALSAAVLIADAAAVLAQNVSSKTPDQHHQVYRKHPRLISGYARQQMRAKDLKAAHPSAFGYAPNNPKDYTLENSRQAGGGGGGGM